MHPNSLKALEASRHKGFFGTGKHRKCLRCNRAARKDRNHCRWHGGPHKAAKKPKTKHQQHRRAVWDKRRELTAELNEQGFIKIESPF